MLIVERWILAALRNQRFFSLAELNRAIAEKLVSFNQRLLQKMKVSRRHLFDTVDKPALSPLPPYRYEFAQWKKVTVNIDYHIEVDCHYYSVPHPLRGQKLDVSMTATTVAVFYKNRRVASHQRSHRKFGHSTVTEHMPKAHQKHLQWTPSRIINWAGKTGPYTQHLVTEIMQRRPHPEQGFRACLGVMRLAKRYNPQRLENACARAVSIGAYTYRSIENIDFRAPRCLDKSLVLRWTGTDWIKKAQNVIILGATGVGKTYLACAIANSVCRGGYPAMYKRAPRLYQEIAIARADGSYPKLMNKLAKIKVLIIDDFCIAPVSDPERRDLLEVLEDRQSISSTIIATQLPIENWIEHIGDPTLADAIMDRLVHNSHRIILKGESMRKVYSSLTKSNNSGK